MSTWERYDKLMALADPSRGGTPAERALARQKAAELKAKLGPRERVYSSEHPTGPRRTDRAEARVDYRQAPPEQGLYEEVMEAMRNAARRQGQYVRFITNQPTMFKFTISHSELQSAGHTIRDSERLLRHVLRDSTNAARIDIAGHLDQRGNAHEFGVRLDVQGSQEHYWHHPDIANVVRTRFIDLLRKVG